MLEVVSVVVVVVVVRVDVVVTVMVVVVVSVMVVVVLVAVGFVMVVVVTFRSSSKDGNSTPSIMWTMPLLACRASAERTIALLPGALIDHPSPRWRKLRPPAAMPSLKLLRVNFSPATTCSMRMSTRSSG